MSTTPIKHVFRISALLAAGGLFVPSLGITQAAPPQGPQEYIEASKREAEALARGMQGMPVFDATGDVERNADGTIRMQPSSPAAGESASKLMSEMTGLSGYQGLASPAGKGGSAGAAATMRGQVTFPCAVVSGTTRAAAGYSFRFNGCRLQDGRVAEVGLQICTKLASGGLCAAEDYTEPAYYPANAYSTIGGVDVGIGCNDSTRTCLITVTGEYSVVGDDAALRQQAQQTQSGRELRDTLTAVVNSDEYQQQVVEQSATRDCYAANQQSFLENGTVTTCDGSQSALVSGREAASCTPQRVCTKTSVSTQPYTTTCTRSWGLTTARCKTQLKTRECTITRDAVNGGIEVSSCTPEELEGASLVNQSTPECIRMTYVPNTQMQVCVGWRYTAYYVYPDSGEHSDCTASPEPLAGAIGPDVCAMNSADVEFLGCPADGWYGRTLSDAECTVTETDEHGNEVLRYLDYREKPGCGVCTRNAEVAFTCRAAHTADDLVGSCSEAELAGCTLVSVDVESSIYGFTTSQRETYRCTRSTTQCLEWQTVNECLNIDASYGVDKMPIREIGDDGAFEQVLAAGEMASAIASFEGAAGGTEYNPRLFEGHDIRCTRPRGFLNGLVANDCCKLNLRRPGGNRPFNTCKDEEVKLAAARRANHTHFIGSYCSKKVSFGFIKKCVEETQTYCVFPGLLPRVVQEAGREQLEAASKSTFAATVQRQTMRFPYYSGEGGWTSPVTVNGNQVAAFQLPAYCSDLRQAAQVLASNPNARECPSTLELYFATCDREEGCGALPSEPEAGSEYWRLMRVDPLKPSQTALSRYTLVEGGCDTTTGQCKYEVSAWPAGIGGRAVVSRDLTFEFNALPPAGDATQTVVLGSAVVRVTPSPNLVAPGQLPPSVPAAVSLDGGNHWQSFDLPTLIDRELLVPGTDIRISGGCLAATGFCDYRLTGTVMVTAKPWGTAQTPDCTGFDLTQLSVLDFSEMDLSEWTATVQASAPSQDALTATAQQQASQGNTWTATSPSQARVAAIHPQQELGPFVARLKIASNWPETYDDPARNTDPIYGVTVDWGDCSPPTRATLVPGVGGFYAEHTYNSPETPGICDKHGAAGPNRGRTLEHEVRLTIDSSSGTHTVTLGVRNIFENYPAASSPQQGTAVPSVTIGQPRG